LKLDSIEDVFIFRVGLVERGCNTLSNENTCFGTLGRRGIRLDLEGGRYIVANRVNLIFLHDDGGGLIHSGLFDFLEVELAIDSSLESWVGRSLKAGAKVGLPVSEVVFTNGGTSKLGGLVIIVRVAILASSGDDPKVSVVPSVCKGDDQKSNNGER
jgi:hypothetical protein